MAGDKTSSFIKSGIRIKKDDLLKSVIPYINKKPIREAFFTTSSANTKYFLRSGPLGVPVTNTDTDKQKNLFWGDSTLKVSDISGYSSSVRKLIAKNTNLNQVEGIETNVAVQTQIVDGRMLVENNSDLTIVPTNFKTRHFSPGSNPQLRITMFGLTFEFTDFSYKDSNFYYKSIRVTRDGVLIKTITLTENFYDTFYSAIYLGLELEEDILKLAVYIEGFSQDYSPFLRGKKLDSFPISSFFNTTFKFIHSNVGGADTSLCEFVVYGTCYKGE